MIFERTLVHVGVSVQVAEKGQMGMDEAWWRNTITQFNILPAVIQFNWKGTHALQINAPTQKSKLNPS